MLTNQKKKKKQRVLLQVAHSLRYYHSPEILVKTVENMACTLGLKITLRGVLTEAEAFPLHTSVGENAHISRHPLFSYQI